MGGGGGALWVKSDMYDDVFSKSTVHQKMYLKINHLRSKKCDTSHNSETTIPYINIKLNLLIKVKQIKY